MKTYTTISVKKYILTCVVIFCGLSSFAQYAVDYLKAADNYFKNGDYYNAAVNYAKYLDAHLLYIRLPFCGKLWLMPR